MVDTGAGFQSPFQKPATVYVVILSAAKNLFAAGKNETLRGVYPERSEGLTVTGLRIFEIPSCFWAILRGRTSCQGGQGVCSRLQTGNSSLLNFHFLLLLQRLLQITLCFLVPLLRSQLEPAHGFSFVLRRALPIPIHGAEFILRPAIPQCRCGQVIF